MKITNKVASYAHVIWDWNGTLVNDVDLAIHAVNKLLSDYGLGRIDHGFYKDVFGFPVENYYRRIGFDLEKLCMEELSTKFHEYYNQGLREHASLFTGVLENLTSIAEVKTQSILSAGAQWHLNDWVTQFDISHLFQNVFGIDNHHATSKVGRGLELMEAVATRAGIQAKDTIMIGDTDHDYEVAQELGIDVLLVADGHQSCERLLKMHHDPSMVIDSRF